MPYEDDFEDEYEDEEDNEDDGSYLFSYDFTPYPVSFIRADGTQTQQPGKELFLGIELEVNSPDGDRRSDVESICHTFGGYAATDAYPYRDTCYLKKDGSLHKYNGFEIVTRPMAPEFTKRFIPALCDKLNKLSIEGHSAGRGYGMHVHVSRAALSPLHQAKMIVFMSSENAESLTYVAQRENNEWCEIKDKRICYYDIRDKDKYQALNNSHCHTMEFRIFRSNTRSERVLKNIEFVLAVIEYTRNCGIRELTTEPFLKWLKNNRKVYPNLFKFLAEKDGSSYTGRYADVLNHRRAKRASNA